MERETKAYRAHVLFFPFPLQGHINPAFQFAKRLASKGLKTTLATTVYVAKSMHVTASKVEVETMSDGYDETGWAGAKSAEEFHQRFRDLCSQGLADLIKKYENTSNPVTCLVHDAVCPWGLNIGKEHGLVVASFFTQACGVSYLFYQVKIGTLIVPVEEPVDSIPGLPTLAVHDLPTQVAKLEFPSTLDDLVGQFNHPDKADWLLFNSFDHLESEEMERETKAYKAHVLFFTLPAQGHINPAFQFAKRLASKGLKTTLVTTVYVAKSMHVTASKVEVETMSDGYDETGWAGAKSTEEYHQRFRDLCSLGLADLIKKYENTSNPVTCLVHDAICPWALDIGKERGLVVAAFFTQACSVSYLFYHVKIGTLIVPVEEPVDSIPGLPTLAVHDLPTLVAKLEFSSSSLDSLMGQFNHPDKADWLLFNSFDHLESEVLKLMGDRWRVRTIGPTTPSMYLDKRVEGDKENSLNMFKPSDENYIKWLNARETGSVVYISFGSIAAFGGEQMEELMWGIRQSKKHFLWVVREAEQSKLPSSFAKETSDKGLVVSWCSQTEVLAHKAVGCFVTHCGWNSTMEALSLGVPMVAMPIIWDQTTNAKFVEDIWESGIRVKVDEKGIVKRDEVESCIREVMEGERGKAIKMNAKRWSELAKDAVDAGGSSDVNIEEFVASLTSI